jgi:DNA-binding NarL/FixJ family response regulator
VTAGVVDSEAAELIRNGVSGIFLKHNSAALLAQGIRDVMAGKVLFGQELLQRAMSSSPGPRRETQSEPFTQRERQVLTYIFEGLANKEIAGRIGYPRVQSKQLYSNSSQKRASEREVSWSE